MKNYSKLTQGYYEKNKKEIFDLISNIWGEGSSGSEMCKEAIKRSFYEEEGSHYYLIKTNSETIGITGYYEIEKNCNIFGLNHHGLIKKYRGKGLGKESLNDLIKIIKEEGNEKIKGILELIPKNNIEVENIFLSMGFVDYTKEALKSLKFINKIISKGYYSKAFLLKDISNNKSNHKNI